MSHVRRYSAAKAACTRADNEQAASMQFLRVFFVETTVNTVRTLHMYSHQYATARLLSMVGMLKRLHQSGQTQMHDVIAAIPA